MSISKFDIFERTHLYHSRMGLFVYRYKFLSTRYMPRKDRRSYIPGSPQRSDDAFRPVTFVNRDFHKQNKNLYLDFGLKILEFLDDSANFN